MTNYNEVVSAIRDLARDQKRLTVTNKFRAQQFDAVNAVAAVEKDIEYVNKNIARAEFKMSQIVDTDPDKTAKEEGYTNEIKDLKALIKSLTDTNLVNAKENVTAIEKKIIDVASGEIKMSIDDVNEIANALIAEFVKEQAKEIVAA